MREKDIAEMGSKKYTAANFIADTEEAFVKNNISEADRKILLRDMVDILLKINENPGEGDLAITIKNNVIPGGVLLFATVPYLRTYDISGRVKHESWNHNGTLHRGGGKPALIEYGRNGGKKVEQWWLEGFIQDKKGRYFEPI